MDKNAIKKYAVWARNELISRVRQKALQYGISEKDCGDKEADVVNGHLLSAPEKKQRQVLISKISRDGYHQVMEEAAYTWFNRFSALRYMEVNGLLPSRVRVFTDEQNKFRPQILAEAINMSLDGLDMKRVCALKEASKSEELYKYLLITQCNALSSILPGLFQKIEDYTELLFPDNILREESVIGQMIVLIPQDDWTDQVQIIGWLYQYYNTELNERVYDGSLSKSRISKELLPAATTIYTPDWAVRYMVQNSLGRLWIEGHPNDELKAGWKYYLEEAQQEPAVQDQLDAIRREYAKLTPEDIRVIDPCMGSGHILVVMFDVLMQIYLSYGYTPGDAVSCIVEKNLWGLDIDDRAAQLAYFAVMMKARQYDRGFFRRKVQPNVYVIEESNGINREGEEYKLFVNGDAGLKKDLDTIMDELCDATEYGSILNVSLAACEALEKRTAELESDSSLAHAVVQKHILPLIKVARALAQKYDVVCTNPPYLGSTRLSPKLNDYVVTNYRDAKADLSVVMYKHASHDMCKKNGFISFITTISWMYLSSFEKIRTFMLSEFDFESLVDFGTELFDGKVGHNPIVAWVNRKSHIDCVMIGIRLVDYCYSRRDEKETEFFNKKNYYYPKQSNFFKIPGAPMAYWVSEKVYQVFSNKFVRDYAFVGIGMRTGNNDRFLRCWPEVSVEKVCFDAKDAISAIDSEKKWFPYNKGGEKRRWYGNNEYIVNWENNGEEIKENTKLHYPKLGDNLGWKISNEAYYFKPLLTWTFISSAGFGGVRYKQSGFISDVQGSMVIGNDNLLKYLAGFLCSKVTAHFLDIVNPTMSIQVKDIALLPVIFNYQENINNIADYCIANEKTDWDSYETSWDFKRHPLVRQVSKISDAYAQWKEECEARFLQLKANEEELNRIFIEIYGLQDELTPDVADKDVTVHRIFDTRDDVPDSMKGSSYVRTKRDEIVSLISYAVGCMFGRYSLDEEGLVLAGGEFDSSRYTTFAADPDNIIPVCDEEYFDDDIAGLFIRWVETVYGKDTLEENLMFIADALGGKGLARSVIRSYFLSGFYADHVKTYQKRPIYWLYDSGKKNGFKALVYMHRYKDDILARIRTEYVHELQSRYQTKIDDLKKQLYLAAGSLRVKLNKAIAKMEAQAEEIRLYEEKVHHLADSMISIDLDDGVKANYAMFADVLAKIK